MKNAPHPLFRLEPGPKAPASPANGFAIGASRFLSMRDRLANAKRGRPPKHMIRAEHVQSVMDRLPAPGSRLHCLLKGDFVLCDLLAAIVQQKGPAGAVHLASLSMSERNADQLAELLSSGQIGSLHLLLSDYFDKTSRADTAPACRAKLAAAVIGTSRSHAKCYVLPCGHDAFVIETSANLRSSANTEQATIFNDADLAKFHAGWIAELVTASNL